jgi:hypothetical protein
MCVINLRQTLDRTESTMRTSTIARLGAGTAAVAAATVGTVLAVSPAEAAKPATPDTACMQAGIGALQELGALSTVAANGLPVADAVDLGVEVREGADTSGIPDPLPLSLILADHRAGDSSVFVYPWCE